MSEIKKIAVIVPSEESRDLYNRFLVNRQGFRIVHYDSLESFNFEAAAINGCDGFIIDMSAIQNAVNGQKEYFNYLLDIFPAVRVTHNPDKTTVIGEIKGRTLRDQALFDFFFTELFSGNSDGEFVIVIIANDEDSLKLYRSQLDNYKNMTFHYYRSAGEFLNEVSKNNHYRGFIIDLRTMMKASPDEKELMHQLIDNFPAIRISHSLDRRVVKGNIRGRHLQNKELFDYFIDDLCRHFIPRGIRTQKRKDMFFNVALEIGDSQELSNTVNLSKDGAFILCNKELKKGDTFVLKIKELTDQEPIQCTVKWVLPWGESAQHLPGVGAYFSRMKPNQKEELIKLLRKRM